MKKQTDFSELIQRKEDAQRPQDMAQRGAGRAQKPPPPPPDEATKALTLKLRLTDYKRLRTAAHDTGRNHQSMMEEAVRMWLTANGF